MHTRPKLPHEDTDDLGDLTGALRDGDQSNDAHEPKNPTRARLLTLEASCAARHARRLTYTDADALTGLPNRTHFQTTLQARLAPTGNPSQMLAVLLLDLDRFKFVNDTLGHDVGDSLLQATSRRLVRAVGAGAYVARLGGDEFTVVLENVSSRIAASAARTITTELAKPNVLDGHDIFVTASIGIAIYPSDGDDAGDLLRHADAAMYRAKRSSHRLAFYEAAMEGSAREHLRLESDLHHAIDRSELVLHYQPEMEAATGRMVAVEALVRWQHPSHGLIGPDTFIPIAEEVGLIRPIGAWVLDSTCAQLKAWRDAGHFLRVAVNFSAEQLQDRDIADMVAAALDRIGLRADDLVVEITESVWLDPQSAAIDNLHRLKRLGVRLAIDDFGTGYASLSDLKHMPVDILKVDRSFVTDLAAVGVDAAIVGGIVSLAHQLDLEVIVEGIETQMQCDLVRGMGCDLVQGHLLGRSLPPTAFTEAHFGNDSR